MKTAMIVKSGLAAVAFLLITTGANAQTTSAARQSTQHQSTQRRSAQPGDAQSSLAAGRHQRKDGAVQSADYGRNAKGPARTTKAQEPSQNSKKGKSPLYEDTGKSGSNPMYEGQRSQANHSGHQPGSGEETKGAPLKGAATSSIPANQRRKHLAGVKYEDRQAAGQPADSPHRH